MCWIITPNAASMYQYHHLVTSASKVRCTLENGIARMCIIIMGCRLQFSKSRRRKRIWPVEAVNIVVICCVHVRHLINIKGNCLPACLSCGYLSIALDMRMQIFLWMANLITETNDSYGPKEFHKSIITRAILLLYRSLGKVGATQINNFKAFFVTWHRHRLDSIEFFSRDLPNVDR